MEFQALRGSFSLCFCLFGCGDRHQGRAQRAVGNGVALLQHAHDGVGVLVGGRRADGLVLMGGEGFARSGVHGQHLVALQRSSQLAQGGFRTFANLLHRTVLDGQAGFKAVGHGQQAFGKTLHAELAGFGDFFFGATARVLGIGLGAQVLVGQVVAFGLQCDEFALRLGQGFCVSGGEAGIHAFGIRMGLLLGFGLLVIGHARNGVNLDVTRERLRIIPGFQGAATAFCESLL